MTKRKLVVLISGRKNNRIAIDGVPDETLTEIRRQVKRELDGVRLFDKEFLDIHNRYGNISRRRSGRISGGISRRSLSSSLIKMKVFLMLKFFKKYQSPQTKSYGLY